MGDIECEAVRLYQQTCISMAAARDVAGIIVVERQAWARFVNALLAEEDTAAARDVLRALGVDVDALLSLAAESQHG